MSVESAVNIVVLYEDELRLAAKAIELTHIVLGDKTATVEQANAVVLGALKACSVALRGAENDGALLVMASRDRFIGTPTPSESGKEEV